MNPVPTQLVGKNFQPGKSGNPGGIPREVRAARKLAAAACPEAIRTLEKWMRGDDPKAAIAACLALLDRGLGKASQMRELYPKTAAAQADGLPFKAADLTDSQLSRMLQIARENLP